MISEKQSQLKNKDNYNRLKYNQQKHTIDQQPTLAKDFKSTRRSSQGLKTENPRTPKFFSQSKIHKKGNPGRPVVSSANFHTSNISKYLGYH